MAAPISPGEVLKIAKGVYKLYKRFHDAPKEMKQLGEQVRLVTAIISQSDNAIMHLDFLKTPEGHNLLDILNGHLREMKKTLHRAKDIAKQWRKAEKNFWRRAPFVLYTMRAIPGLRADSKFELDLIESVKTQAFQIGVPAALKQLEAKVAAQNKQRKAQSQDEFIATEKKRKAACTALKQSSMTKQPATVAEKRDQTLSTLRQSGLPDDEVQTLLSLHEKAVQEAIAKSSTKQGAASTTSKKPQPKKKQGQSNKPSTEGTSKPKIVVIQPKSKDSASAEAKSKSNQKESTPSGTKLKAPSTKHQDTESEKSKQTSSNASTPKRSNSPANGNQKVQDNKSTKEPEKGKNPVKQNNNKNAEGDKNTTTGKQTDKPDTPKKTSQQKPETKGETDTNTKPNTKQNLAKSISNQSETPAKQPKPPAKAKANDNPGKPSEQVKQPQDKSAKADDKKKSSSSSSTSAKANEVAPDTKKAEKPKGQPETLTAQSKEAKSRSPSRSKAEQAKSDTQIVATSSSEKKAKKSETKDTNKAQPAVVTA